MASLSQHMKDCNHLIGDPCEDVNRWMDEFFTEFGAGHRFKRHHREGVEAAQEIFGERGRRAAIVHILRDCRNIPREKDYANGSVDKLGLEARWPVTAYIRYPDDAFERLAMFKLNGPEAVINLGFIKSQDDLFRLLLTQSVNEGHQQIESLLQIWPSCVEQREKLPPLTEAVVMPLTEIQETYASELEQHPLLRSLRAQFPAMKVQLIDMASLINPLVWFDLEYIEQLRAELVGTEEVDTIRFAIPKELNVTTRIAADADGRGVSLISPQKQVAVMAPEIEQVPGIGMSVKFNIAGTPQLILASRVNGRYYLRNGMHRAYLLASLGIQHIPTVIIDEPILTPTATMFPSFNNEILEASRPPVLADMFADDLTARIQILRTTKVVRIRVEEMLFPVD
jgi:hypothetical protein